MDNRPTETSITASVAALIAATQVNAAPLVTKVVPRWVLGLTVGEVVNYLAPRDLTGTLLPINAWLVTMQSWVPAKVKSGDSKNPTPIFTPGFDDVPGGSDPAAVRDQKIAVAGSLKVWQLVEYRQGDDSDNSETQSALERQAVIDSITRAPRLGISWFDLEHDELKASVLSQVPSNSSLIHVAQCALPFTFSYVVTAA